MLICLVTVPVCSARSGRGKAKPVPMSVSDLLDKYAETQDRLQSIILKSESRGTKSCYRIEAGTVFYSFCSQELRYDGKRICVRANHWGQLSLQINAPKQQPQYMSTLWDGKKTYHYIIGSASVKEKVKGCNPSGTCIIYQPIKRNQAEITLSDSDVHIFGYFCGDRERFDTILRKAKSVKVLKKMEKVNGSDCFVIVADTKYGKYKIWLDPNHGYHIAKAVVERGPGDFVQATNYTQLKGTKDAHIIQNTRFKKFDGIWIPIESTFIRNIKYQKDDWAKVRYHKKITEVILNPDHEVLSSFAPDDIKNGAKVYIQQVPGVYYTWQDGKVVDEKGQKVDLEKVKVKSKKAKEGKKRG